MNKKDFWSAVLLTIAVIIAVIVLDSDFITNLVLIPAAFLVGCGLLFGAIATAIFYFKEYIESHPYIPYAGRLAHVLCTKCYANGVDSSITMTVGTAFEEWSKDGIYRRSFKRLFRCKCSVGHEWTYDPVFERNVQDKREGRKNARRANKQSKGIVGALARAFHKQYVEPHEKNDATATEDSPSQ